MKNSTINGEEITDELRRKIASRLRGKAKIATPDTVDSLLMEAVYGDDVMGVYAKRYLTDIADLIDPSGFDSEDERKADVLLRFYTAPGERAVLLYRDTIAFVSETMPEPGDTVTVKSSRELSKDVMLNHRFQIG